MEIKKTRLKKNLVSKDSIKKRKDNPKNGRKYLQIINLTRDLYLEYINNSYDSVIKDK